MFAVSRTVSPWAICDFSHPDPVPQGQEDCRQKQKGETCYGGIVAENGNTQAAFKYLCGNVVFSHKTQRVSYSKYSLQLLVRLVPGPEKIVVVHLLEVQTVQLINIVL